VFEIVLGSIRTDLSGIARGSSGWAAKLCQTIFFFEIIVEPNGETDAWLVPHQAVDRALQVGKRLVRFR
jgi:hypothetical protein